MYGEPMKIQIGKLYINNTRRYLFPVIKYYGEEFTNKINKLFKVGIGIGDIITNKCNIRHEKHLFILVDTLPSSADFALALKYFKNHPSYEDDYAFDQIHKGRLHMLVIKVPDEFLETIDKFKAGEYSRMYSPEQIKNLFSYKGDDEIVKKMYEITQKVLIHDHNYSIEFAKKIKKEFALEELPEIKADQEFELPILLQEEFFNVTQTENEP
jgi:hypothetical protein